MSQPHPTANKAEGLGHQAKGAVKETVGDAIGNERMQAEGKVERVQGQAEKKVGDAEAFVERNTK